MKQKTRSSGCLFFALGLAAFGIWIVLKGDYWGVALALIGALGLWGVLVLRSNPFLRVSPPVGAVVRKADPEASSFWSDTESTVPIPSEESIENVVRVDVAGRPTLLLESVDSQGFRTNWVLMRTSGAVPFLNASWAADDRGRYQAKASEGSEPGPRWAELSLSFWPGTVRSTGTMMYVEYPRVANTKEVQELYARLPELADLASRLESLGASALPVAPAAKPAHSAHDAWVDAVAYLPPPIHRAPAAPAPPRPTTVDEGAPAYLPYPPAPGADLGAASVNPHQPIGSSAETPSYTPYPFETEPYEITPYDPFGQPPAGSPGSNKP